MLIHIGDITHFMDSNQQNNIDFFRVGDKVSKKSKKPFKNGESIQFIANFSVNDIDPEKRDCAVFSDGSVCNLEMLIKED